MRQIGRDPIFVARGEGAELVDVDGNRYVDWVMSWGPLLFGHADAETLAAVEDALARGTTFGAPTEAEVELAAEIVDAVPSVELVRLVSSGTEAAMSALRVARGFTKRDKIVKIDGGYHGHSDCLLAAAGSGAVTLGLPGSAGVPKGAVADTIVVPFNDLDAIRAAFDANRNQIAAVIVEPIPANMGVEVESLTVTISWDSAAFTVFARAGNAVSRSRATANRQHEDTRRAIRAGAPLKMAV